MKPRDDGGQPLLVLVMTAACQETKQKIPFCSTLNHDLFDHFLFEDLSKVQSPTSIPSYSTGRKRKGLIELKPPESLRMMMCRCGWMVADIDHR